MRSTSRSPGQYTGWYSVLGALLSVLVAGGAIGTDEAHDAGLRTDAVCVDADVAAAEPGRVELDPTRAGAGFEGWMELTFARSPYGVTVSADGRYVYDLVLRVRAQREIEGRRLVAWATTRDLDQVQKLGVLDEEMIATGQVDWNKFLVLVTAEASADVETWEGDILLTGMSPSGKMHTMAGHGIFEAHGIGC